MNPIAQRKIPFAAVLAVVLTALFLFSLIPVLSAARYAAPESDDLLYGESIRQAWHEQGTLSAALRAAGQKVAHHHTIAHGRFANTFFGALFLGLFGLDHYACVPVLMIGSLVFGTLLFFYALIGRLLKGGWAVWLSLAMFALTMQVQLLPSPAEGLFWFCGGLGYTLYYAGTLTLFALLILSHTSRRTGARAAFGTLAVLIAAVLSGLGFTLMLITAALLIGYAVLCVLQKRRDMWPVAFAVLAVFAAGCVIQLTAPAVQVRAAWEQEMYGYAPMGVVQAVAASFAYALGVLVHGLDGGMLVWIALTAALCAPVLQKSPYPFRLPLLVLAGSVCLYATLFTASLYATSTMGPYRQRNLMFFMEYIFWGVNAAYATGWLVKRGRFRADAPVWLLDAHRLAALAIVAILMLSTVLIRGINDATAVAAMRETLSGSAAARYRTYAEERALDRPQGQRAESRLYLY